MYYRKIYQDIKDHLSKSPITVLTGMRQTGKTTLIKQLLADLPSSNKLYIDLERLDQRELFSEKNYDNIMYAWQQRGLDVKQLAYIALDEIQFVPNLPSILKYLHDHYTIKFIVTGSSSYYIKNLFTESLAGRKKIFELYQLDFGEFLTFKQVPYQASTRADWPASFQAAEFERLKAYYEEYIAYGGFPAVVLAETISDKKDLLFDLLSSYVTVDIKSLADFRNDQAVYQLIKMLAARVGSRLDYAKLSRLVGLSDVTVKNYVDFFEKTYLLTRVPVFTRNADRAIVKAQKLYFCDNGLLNILADIDSGSEFENALFNQLKHHGEVSYYALKTGREIDFILNRDMALEAKETPTTTDNRTLAHLAQTLQIKQAMLVGRHRSQDYQNYIWGGNIL